MSSPAAPEAPVPAIPVAAVAWFPCHRLIPSRFPTVGLYDQIAAPQDRVVGKGATLIMAAFTHLNPLGSRFSDGSWGVYYAADSFDTALAEVSCHRAAFLERTAEPAIDIDLRWLHADLLDKLHDLRVLVDAMPAVYHPSSYAASQALARTLRGQGSPGIAYRSVRRPEGQCAAILRPNALSNARVAGHLGLHWDGRTISHWYEKGAPHAL